jgi:hypothetical protein
MKNRMTKKIESLYRYQRRRAGLAMVLRRWIISISICTSNPVYAGFCAQWDTGQRIGHLSPKEVREASGAASSQKFPGRVYWIKGFFYYSDANGKNLKRVKIAGFKPRDTEALAIAECNTGPCLAIGDIGDNRAKRKNIKIVFVPELENYPKEVKILRTLTLNYPIAAHDAEALAFLPSGDLLLLTKEIRLAQLAAGASKVFRLPRDEWFGSNNRQLILKKWGELPLPSWLETEIFFAQVPTDMAVNINRQVLGILTYGKIIEIPLKFINDIPNSAAWKKEREYSVVNVETLAQQESLTYLNAPDRLLWSTEYRMPEAPIFSMTCTQQAP